MILLEGYYKGDPLIYKEKYINSDVAIYFHTAYYFLDGSKVISAGWSGSNNFKEITKEELIRDGTPCEYEVMGDELSIFYDRNTKFETVLKFVIVDEYNLKGRGTTYKFICW